MAKVIEPLEATSSVPFLAAIPGSKSYTNRALIIAAMRPGATAIEGGLVCDDTRALARALDSFGGLSVTLTGGAFRVARTAETIDAPEAALDLGAAGTPARLLLAFAAAARGATVLTGSTRLRERPMADLLDGLRAIGIRCECLDRPGCLPVRVHGGAAHGSEWRVASGVSSQFTSALLLLAAQQRGCDEVRLALAGSPVSEPYVDMTLAIMNACGVPARRDGAALIVVTPATPTADRITVEVDASSMGYFLVAAAATRSTVEVSGIGTASAQGDVGLARLLADMGCAVEADPDRISVEGRALRGIDVDLRSMPDVVLTVAALAALAEGPTRIRGIGGLRLKESDRVHAAATELARLGVAVTESSDALEVRPTGPLKPARIRTWDDHRVAMAFAVLGLASPGIEIEDPDCVAKSFPGFWDELDRFRAHHVGDR